MGERSSETDHTPGWPCGGRIKCPACCATTQRDVIREALAVHFVMWHDLAVGFGAAGEWRCACGLKFGFSDSAIDHMADAVRSDLAGAELPDPDCGQCEGGNPRCLQFVCGERQDGRHSKWWCEYGCCSHAHAVDHYGEEAIDA